MVGPRSLRLSALWTRQEFGVHISGLWNLMALYWLSGFCFLSALRGGKEALGRMWIRSEMWTRVWALGWHCPALLITNSSSTDYNSVTLCRLIKFFTSPFPHLLNSDNNYIFRHDLTTEQQQTTSLSPLAGGGKAWGWGWKFQCWNLQVVSPGNFPQEELVYLVKPCKSRKSRLIFSEWLLVSSYNIVLSIFVCFTFETSLLVP